MQAGEEPVTVEAANGSVEAHPGAADKPDAVMTGPPRLISAVLRGEMKLARARASGLHFKGDAQALRRVQPLVVGPKAHDDASTDERRSTP